MELIAQLLLESRIGAYIDWLDDNLKWLILDINKDSLLALLSAKRNQQTIKLIIFL